MRDRVGLGTVEESDVAFGNRLAFVSVSLCLLLSPPRWWNRPDYDDDDDGSIRETIATNQGSPMVVGDGKATMEEGWPCLVFANAFQLRRVLGKSKRYDDDVRQIRMEILSHVQGGGRTSDPVAYVLGDPTFYPCEKRLVFLSPADLAPESLGNMSPRCDVAERLRDALQRDPGPTLRSALYDALYIHWCALRAAEHERHPMPSPGQHAPCA
jgi:hypothetical protein